MEHYALPVQVYGAGLVFARVGSLALLLPGVGEGAVPPRIRLAFAFLFALVLYPVVRAHLPPVPGTVGGLGAAVGIEILIGLGLGTLLRLFMMALAVAGEVVSIQTTLSFAQTTNPMLAQPTATLATFLSVLGLTLVFATDLHQVFIAGVARSYDVFAPARGVPVRDFGELMVRSFGQVFAIGVQLAAPVIVFSLIFNIAVGLIGRAMPQFQVFFVATPLAVLLGLSVFAVSLGVLGLVWTDRYRDFAERLAGGWAEVAEGSDDASKTEDPTPRRIEEARRKGDVAKSPEVGAFAALLVASALVLGGGPAICRGMAQALLPFLAHPDAFRLSGGDGTRVLYAALAAAWPGAVILVAAGVAGAAATLLQQGPVWSPSKLAPDPSKINPFQGLKRLVGIDNLANFIKSLVKLAAVAGACWWALRAHMDTLQGLSALDPAAILPFVAELVRAMAVSVLTATGVLAGADWLWSRLRFTQRMKMSREEVKQDHKDADGDPHVKARRRQIALERSRRRMAQAVPTATLVVMNPTHYAVALRYVQGETAAPLCVAKGVDSLALKIREIAEAHGVSVVEDPPLARALYAAVEIDRTIPREHYEAVAKLIGFILSAGRPRPRVPAAPPAAGR